MVAKKKSARFSSRGERVHGDIQGERSGTYAQVFAMVRRIPRGRVMTYGQIATLIENRLSARAVGWAMHGCPEGVPWQRVVNAGGGCSTDRLPDIPPGMQRSLLESEGVEFRANGTLDLTLYRWTPTEHRAKQRVSGKSGKSRQKRAATRTAKKK
jgi:methylated-DNA-protein-cysteine methyltransferase-like protein